MAAPYYAVDGNVRANVLRLWWRAAPAAGVWAGHTGAWRVRGEACRWLADPLAECQRPRPRRRRRAFTGLLRAPLLYGVRAGCVSVPAPASAAIAFQEHVAADPERAPAVEVRARGSGQVVVAAPVRAGAVLGAYYGEVLLRDELEYRYRAAAPTHVAAVAMRPPAPPEVYIDAQYFGTVFRSMEHVRGGAATARLVPAAALPGAPLPPASTLLFVVAARALAAGDALRADFGDVL